MPARISAIMHSMLDWNAPTMVARIDWGFGSSTLVTFTNLEGTCDFFCAGAGANLAMEAYDTAVVALRAAFLCEG